MKSEHFQWSSSTYHQFIFRSDVFLCKTGWLSFCIHFSLPIPASGISRLVSNSLTSSITMLPPPHHVLLRVSVYKNYRSTRPQEFRSLFEKLAKSHIVLHQMSAKAEMLDHCKKKKKKSQPARLTVLCQVNSKTHCQVGLSIPNPWCIFLPQKLHLMLPEKSIFCQAFNMHIVYLSCIPPMQG